jgi:DNA helicase-2/ATP-dependent DNA helicase PcrA
VVKLEQNYRSDQTILEAAHAVISRNKRRMDKKLWSARAKGEPLGLIVTRDERGEAQEVAAKIHELRRDGITDYDQMAVFFRANAQSRVIEETFRLMRVPYVLVSGRSFYERAEVKDAASYLRLMANPRSDADLERVINVPARGIGDTTIERLREYAAEQGLSLYEAIEFPERVSSLGGAAVKRLKAFRELAEKLVLYAKHTPDATSAARFMLEQTGLVATYMAEGTDEAIGRAENLKELLTATGEFDRQREERLAASGLPLPAMVPMPEGPGTPGTPDPEPEVEPSPQGDLFAAFHRPLPVPLPAVVVAEKVVEAPPAPAPLSDDAPLELEVPPLQGFLEQLSLVGDADGETGVGKQRVSLMTMHAAKGLEFDAVFITGMEEEVFPNRRATKPEASEEEMSEERRLCYVGFTRARRRLFCSLSQSRALFGELKYNAPSRFLAEVPQELFGFHQIPEIDRPSHRPPQIRRRGEEGDDGVHVDRTYDQSTDFHQDGEGEVKGMRVAHTQFGRGQVIEVVGKGPNAKLTIRFDNFGVKTVIARFLQPA